MTLSFTKAVGHDRVNFLDALPEIHGARPVTPKSVQLNLRLFLLSNATVLERLDHIGKSVLFCVIAGVFTLLVSQVLQNVSLLEQKIHDVYLSQLDQLDQQRVAIIINVVDIGTSFD